MPPSGQHITGSKADIFTPVSIDGSGGGGTDEDQSIKEAMSEEVDKRMNKALDDLKVKYGTDGEGVPGRETSEHGPTGTEYRKKEKAEMKERLEREAERKYDEQCRAEVVQKQAKRSGGDESDDDDDEEYMKGLDVDVVEQLREKRLAEMKNKQQERIENIQKGHGRYTEIVQDEFLNDVLKSKHSLVHFYHPDFERSKIMDHHLSILAGQHVEAKFMKMNAEKCPFFVKKLQIQVIPTVVVFRDGVAIGRLVGFDGLTDGLDKGKEDEFKTEALATWLAEAQVIQYEAAASEAEIAKFTVQGMRQAMMVGYADGVDDIEGDYE